ncbi:MAG: beta-galactosidase trimerization domain-containing protein [Planctomycetaceae bacterium]|nr:beta-galactosidase trimerization domain-containing protein [Planctomycetaceae bacterium]
MFSAWFLVAASVTCQAADVPYLTPDRQFTSVQAPAWVKEGAVKVFLSLDDQASIAETAAIGATIVHAGGPALYYPLRRDDPQSGIPEPERSQLLKGINFAKQQGLRVILGVSPYAPIEIVQQHPEWMHHATDDPELLKRANLDLNRPENIGLRSLPLNTPYGDYAIECLAEMLQDLGVDGFSFDGCYHPFINFSPYEKSLYQQETGRAFPTRIDLNDDDYRYYLLWLDEKLEHWYRKLGQRLQQVNSEAVIYTWTTNAGRYGHFLTSPRVMSARMNRLIHCPVQEWWLDEVNLGSTVVPYFGAAYVRAVSGGQVGASEPYLMSRGNPYTTDSFPPHELTVRCLGAMTNGSFTPLAQMAGKSATYATLREIAARKEVFINLQQEPWAALLVSEQTRQFYAHGNIVERWLSHALGFYRMGMEEHLPLNLITELELTPAELDRYRVLILPNVACLSDEQIATIRQYVERGGGLVATCETSLFDEMGHARADFGLADVFGTSYAGRPQAPAIRSELDANFAIVVDDSYWAQRGNAGAFRFGDYSQSIFATDTRLQHLVPNLQATFKGPLIQPTEFVKHTQPGVLYFPEGSREPFPVVANGQFGQGRVVYFAAGVDAALFSYGFPYQRVMLSRAVQWAAQEYYPIEVKAPMCVQSTFWKQGAERTIVHLWNGLNTTSDHGQQDVEAPLREESIPIHGIQLRVQGRPYQQARCVPGDQIILPRDENGVTIFDIPPVEVHLAIVLEAAQGK